MHCEKGQPLELIEKVITEAENCDMCGVMFEKDPSPQKIWKHKNFKTKMKQRTIKGKLEMVEVEDQDACCKLLDVCCKCYSKYFVRRQLDKKSSNHSKFEAYRLEPQKQKEEEHQVNNEVCVVKQKTLVQLETESTDFKEELNDTVVDFAKLSPHLGFKKPNQNRSKFVLLGLWKR